MNRCFLFFLLFFLCTRDLWSLPEMDLRLIQVIKGSESKLNRPEGIDFSPTGDCLAVANSDGNSITIFKQEGAPSSLPAFTPSCIIEEPDLLKYAHDVKISPCGNYLAIACREADAIVFFQRDEAQSCTFRKQPYSMIAGPGSLLANPASLAFSPCGRILAVCNRSKGGGMTFYKSMESDPGHFESMPFYHLAEETLLSYGVSAPHGITFLPDGAYFAVVHKKYYKNPQAAGRSALAIYKTPELGERQLIAQPISITNYGNANLHSVAVHPKEPLLMVVDELQGVTFFRLEGTTENCLPIASLDVSKHTVKKAPVKGGAISPDGSYFAITTEESSLLIYEFPKIFP